MKCHTDASDVASAAPCKKYISKSQLVPDLSLEQSKVVCAENDNVMGFDWDPKASVFYDGREDTNDENEKCAKSLTASQGSGSYVACVKVPERKRGFFIGAIVLGAAAIVLMLTWLIMVSKG